MSTDTSSFSLFGSAFEMISDFVTTVSEVQTVRLSLTAFFVYACTWLFATEWKVSRILPLHLPFWFGAIIITMSSILVSIFGQGLHLSESGNMDANLLFFGGVGAAAAFASALFHHPSTRISLLGSAVLAAFVHAYDYDITDEKVRMVLMFIFNIFLLANLGSLAREL